MTLDGLMLLLLLLFAAAVILLLLLPLLLLLFLQANVIISVYAVMSTATAVHAISLANVLPFHMWKLTINIFGHTSFGPQQVTTTIALIILLLTLKTQKQLINTKIWPQQSLSFFIF